MQIGKDDGQSAAFGMTAIHRHLRRADWTTSVVYDFDLFMHECQVDRCARRQGGNMQNCAKNVLVALGCMLGLAACSAPPRDNADFSARSAEESAVLFTGVVARVEPVAEQYCRDTTQRLNCDFEILVLDDASAPANAFQTLNRAGRPQIVFTLALIADARNGDELALCWATKRRTISPGTCPKRAAMPGLAGLFLAD